MLNLMHYIQRWFFCKLNLHYRGKRYIWDSVRGYREYKEPFCFGCSKYMGVETKNVN